MRNSKLRFDIRKKRVRSKIARITDRPRLSVFKSGRHVYAQIIDDVNATTIVSASTLDKEINIPKKSNCNVAAAIQVGELIAKKAILKGVNKVVFDKGGNKYHGVIKALSEAAREILEF